MLLAARFGLVLATLAMGFNAPGPSDPVVPPAGAVAGGGYASWLAVKDREFFDSGGSVPTCRTVRTASGTALFLDGSETHAVSCDAAAGEGVYIDGPSNECSTLKGDHSGYGTSAAQLEACAKAGYASAHVSGTASLDGAAVTNYDALLAGTDALAVRIPSHNDFGVKGGPATTACYGEGLLLEGLRPGEHTIVIHATIGTNHNIVRYTLHVR